MAKLPLRAAYGRGTRHHVRAGGATAVGAANERSHARAEWPAARGRPASPVSTCARWLRRLGDDVLTAGHARTRDRPTVRTETVKGELDGGISSAAGGPVQVVRDRPDVMSREGAERQARTAGLCEECRMREAHYGFRMGWRAERRTTLCFPCFRSELGRRQGALARRSGVDSPGLDATQARLPLAGTLETLRTRGRHAQIAARHALDGDVPVQALDPLRATGSPVSWDFRGRHARRRPAAHR